MSYNFQAPGFYEKCKFERVAELVDWPPGNIHIVLRRDLNLPSDEKPGRPYSRMAARSSNSTKPFLDERSHEEHSDEVEETSRDSFPASDPPSWTPIIGSGGPSQLVEAQENARDERSHGRNFRDAKRGSRASPRARRRR
jgi:hypothetical protein